MNFLAHLYLAPANEEIRLGCFIADAVKGSKYKDYSEDIQKGILLHRREDDFTDKHPIIKECIVRLRPSFRLYASVVIDIYTDHFLAKNWKEYSDIPLSEFAENSYNLIEKYKDILPERMKEVFRYMKQGNWLGNYHDLPFLQKVFEGMSRRTPYESNMASAVEVLKENYTYLEDQFRLFFPDCIDEFVL